MHRALFCNIDLLCTADHLDAIRELSIARACVAVFDRYATQRALIASQIQHTLPLDNCNTRLVQSFH
jgi:hypothetical protein